MVNILANKHLVAALLVTPILAVLGYFMVDHIVAEKPHKAIIGKSYPLLAKPNCRYKSGMCSVKNGDFEAHLTIEQKPQQTVIYVSSVINLEGGRIAFTKQGLDTATPVPLIATGDNQTKWQASFMTAYTGDETLQLVLAANGVLYYGETTAAFGEYETSFGKDFRAK